MAVATITDAGADRRTEQRAAGDAEIDYAAAGAHAGSLAGGLVIIAPLIPLGAAVLLLFMYLTGVALVPAPKPVPIDALVPSGGPAMELTRQGVQPLRALAREAPVTLSILLTAAAWFAAALVMRQCRLTSPRHASGSVFDDVLQRYISLHARIRALGDFVPDRPFERAAFEEARGLCRNLGHQLGSGGPGWALGTSYVNIWRLVHRAEEALLVVQPHADTIADAASDEIRIRDSRMQNEKYLLHQLEASVRTLDPAAPRFLVDANLARASGLATNLATVADQVPLVAGGSPAAQAYGNGADNGATGDDGTVAGAEMARKSSGTAAVAPGISVVTMVQLETPPSTVSTREQQARERQAVAVIRSVRRAINDFRDTRRDELVRLRNHLRATTTMTNVATFVILAFAIRALITDDAPRRASPLDDPIVAATAFYFVGALVGLIDQLYRESRTQSAIEDFGLFDARLTLTPVLSGLSAVGGVLLGAMLLGTIGTSAIIPGEVPSEARSAASSAPPTAPPAGSTARDGGPPTLADVTTPGVAAGAAVDPRRSDGRRGLADIFSLNSYAFGLAVAAIFGLTPRLFIDRLRTESNAYVRDLQATTAGESRPTLTSKDPGSVRNDGGGSFPATSGA